MVDEAPALPTTGYAVLGLLSFGEELSGYDLKKWADHSLHLFFWSPAISNIYRELQRLQALGYVTAREAAQDDLRNKRMFRITASGRKALASWVEHAPIEPAVLKDHVLLRVWLGHVTDDEQLVELVAAEEEATRAQIEGIRYNIDSLRRQERTPYVLLVEEWCLRNAEARLASFAELRRSLERLRARGRRQARIP